MSAGEKGAPVQLHKRLDRTGGEVSHRLALLHGVGSDLGTWDEVVARLPPGFEVLRYDLRGHGRSPKPPGPYSLDDFVTDHVRTLAELGWCSCELVGFSLGGMIAQAVALSAPSTVDRLAILSSVAGRTPEERSRVEARLEVLRDGGPREIAKVSGERWFTPEFVESNREFVSHHLARFAANDPPAYLAAYEVLAGNDLCDQLARIAQPTLIMTGEFDVGSPPRMSETMHAAIHLSELVIVPGQKHELLIEVPDVVVEQMTRFLNASPSPAPQR